MKKYLSPGNLIVTAGGMLAFVGMTAYFTDSVNLSVPTFFLWGTYFSNWIRFKDFRNTSCKFVEQEKFCDKSI